MGRVRVVPGSCWPCKKRRIRCGLEKPACLRCVKGGAECDYNTQLIRWSSRPPVRSVPAIYMLSGLGSDGLGKGEKQALDYFHGRVWPLLQTSEEPCAPMLPVALEHQVVRLATCVLSDSHKSLQEGRVQEHADRDKALSMKRLECLTAIRSAVDSYCVSKKQDAPNVLLFAVLLLYLHDGFMELTGDIASTDSHHKGVLAIIERLGGIEPVLRGSQESLQMLLSEFASTDLTTALLRGTAPSYLPQLWDAIDEGAVWWGQVPLGPVLRGMSSMGFYHEAISTGHTMLSMEQVHAFEDIFRPAHATVATAASDSSSNSSSPESLSEKDIEAIHASALIRSFQHTALIFLYRAVCGLSIEHSLVQQNVKACLDSIMEIQRPSKLLHCVIFPLWVAGAHAQSTEYQQEVVALTDLIYDNMRFASVRAVAQTLHGIWESPSQDLTWAEMFSQLSPHVLVL